MTRPRLGLILTGDDRFGNYSVCEAVQPGWTRTYPQNSCYDVNISQGLNKTDMDFGNLHNID